MALSPKLDFRQSQSLTMTPQLMQSIKLLQMTYLELEQFIDLEIERNPLLDRAVSEDGEAFNADNFFVNNDIVSDPQILDDDWFRVEGVENSNEISSALDSSLENIFPDDSGHNDDAQQDYISISAFQSDMKYSATGYDIVALSVSAETLTDHISQQIALAFCDANDRIIAHTLMDALDESGYIRVNISRLAQGLGIETATIHRVLTELQGFDPPGIFARDLSECLAIQLHLKGRYTPAMAVLLDNLDMLGKRDFLTLQKLCGLDQADILLMFLEIQKLDPKPAARFDHTVADMIIPDIMVTQSDEDTWFVELNPAVMPRLIIDNGYYAEVSSLAKADEKVFLTDCMQSASWLVRSLDQRARTITKVAQEIIRQQDGFLRNGITELKPLNLRAIADAVGMHESTISRVTANKFIQTPRGVFELRYFFNAAISSSEGGDAYSSETVRHRIRQMIDAETPCRVLSDDVIAEILKKDGVDIARRTVAKYREAMNISSSVQRRREKKAKQTVSE